jgi:hypothetical protein
MSLDVYLTSAGAILKNNLPENFPGGCFATISIPTSAHKPRKP